MKRVLTIVAYIGLVFVMLGAILTFRGTMDYLTAPASVWSSPEERWRYFEWTGLWAMLGWLAAGLGVLLALIGGLIARPRYLWIGLMAIGLILVLSFGTYVNIPNDKPYYQLGYTAEAVRNFVSRVPQNLFFMLPGLVCIIEGLVIRKSRIKRAQV